MDSRRIEMMLSELEEARAEFEDSVEKTREMFRTIEDTLQAELDEDSPTFEEEVDDQIKEIHDTLTEINPATTFCEIRITGGKEDDDGNVYRDFKNGAIKRQAGKEELKINPSSLAEALEERDEELIKEKKQEYGDVEVVALAEKDQ